MHIKKTVVAVALGLGFAAFAQAADITYLGELSLSKLAINDYGAPYRTGSGNDYSFEDLYSFKVADDLLGISNPALYTSVFSISIGPGNSTLWGFDNLTVAVYKGNGTAGELVFEQAAVRTEMSNGKMEWTVNSDFALNSSEYTLKVFGATTGPQGGLYAITLQAAAQAVPEPAEYAMLLAGLGVVGMVTRRRKMNIN